LHNSYGEFAKSVDTCILNSRVLNTARNKTQINHL